MYYTYLQKTLNVLPIGKIQLIRTFEKEFFRLGVPFKLFEIRVRGNKMFFTFKYKEILTSELTFSDIRECIQNKSLF